MRALKILIFLFIGLLVGLETGGKAYAGLNVSVSGGNWAIGTVQGGEVATSGTEGRTDDKWTVTGSSDGTEDVYIKVTGQDWSPGSSAGSDQFILKHDVSESWGSAITNSGNGIELKGSLEAGGTQDFDLQFTAPTGGTEGAETLTVTLTATNWEGPPACDGYLYDDKCWYLGELTESCDTVCSSHGGCKGAYSDTSDCQILNALGVSCGTCTGGASTFKPGVIGTFCHYNGESWSSSATFGSFRRLCVCNN